MRLFLCSSSVSISRCKMLPMEAGLRKTLNVNLLGYLDEQRHFTVFIQLTYFTFTIIFWSLLCGVYKFVRKCY